jgi:hypothetical protein
MVESMWHVGLKVAELKGVWREYQILLTIHLSPLYSYVHGLDQIASGPQPSVYVT